MKHIPAKKLRYGLIQFYDETWKVAFYLLYNCKLEQLKKWVRREFNQDVQRDRQYGGITLECVDETGACSDVVAIDKWDDSARSHSILAHECLHVVLNSFGRRGVGMESETVAYFLESLIRRSLEGLKKAQQRTRSRKKARD